MAELSQEESNQCAQELLSAHACTRTLARAGKVPVMEYYKDKFRNDIITFPETLALRMVDGTLQPSILVDDYGTLIMSLDDIARKGWVKVSRDEAAFAVRSVSKTLGFPC